MKIRIQPGSQELTAEQVNGATRNLQLSLSRFGGLIRMATLSGGEAGWRLMLKLRMGDTVLVGEPDGNVLEAALRTSRRAAAALDRHRTLPRPERIARIASSNHFSD